MESSKQRVLFFLPDKALFDATEHYCSLIAAAFERDINYDLKIVKNLTELTEEDFLITIRLHDIYQSRIKPKKLIHWFQGIAPEERVLGANYTLRSRITSLRTCYYERKALKKADLCLFVSDKMRDHYESKYFLSLTKKSIVIPCYNLRFIPETVEITSRYEKPSFVYAGSIHKWQCIEEMLLVFRSIQQRIPSANLTILTKDSAAVQNLVDKNIVQNVSINYVHLSELQKELSKYKYGFLLRKNIAVNNVATPTKMNSYLAAGLIPIYTSFVNSFEKNIDLEHYSLKFDEIDAEKMAEKITLFDKQRIELEEIKTIYVELFKNYYNDELYIEKIEEQIKRLTYGK